MASTVKRLLYGYLSQSHDAINISIPWRDSDIDGRFKLNRDPVRAATDNLRSWAKTNWGERVNRFRFGLDVRRYIFSPVSIAKEALLENARQQIPVFFPNIVQERLEIITHEDDNRLQENTIIFFFQGHLKNDEDKKISINERIG